MVTVKLISAFVFAIVQSLYYLNLKFQASSHLLVLYSPVRVGPGRKPQRLVFSQRGSYIYEWHCEKTSFGVADEVQPKPVIAATEARLTFEISNLETIKIKLSSQRKTKLISLPQTATDPRFYFLHMWLIFKLLLRFLSCLLLLNSFLNNILQGCIIISFKNAQVNVP